ncbi:cytochrome c biogenesis protein ResB [Anaeromyxobacter paludicola]|uniref:ResB-like domain-containing protein n=1 Tax=Anaeromyxobacter paludicola TaxID=2918171 RepID=A0ABM7XAG0_9BACT|nr:cytochrome c biogenesis protein ResB [Anaeromyxobacter paludicola]BDG08843.1 hypothetical protein AMPC_19560 [Anaeromyxobacter paludicola]
MRLVRLLLSRRLVVSLMAILTALLALAAASAGGGWERLVTLAPGAAQGPLARLEAPRLVASPAFLALPALLALSLLASLWTRLAAHLRRRRAGPPPLERHVARWSEELPVPADEAVRRIGRGLRMAGVALRPLRAPEASGSRAGLGFWGSTLFHLGLLVALAGTCASALGRFRGELVLAERIPVEVRPAALAAASRPETACGLDGVRLAVSDVSASYAELQRLTDVSAVLEILPAGAPGRREFLSVNVPVRVGGCQLMVERYGFAPEVEAWDELGRQRLDGVASVPARPPGAESQVALDGSGELQLRMYPDYVERAGAPGSRSRVPLRPVLGFRWLEGGREVAAGLVPRGGATVVNGRRVAFRDLRYWLGLSLVRDPGLDAFAAGGVLCLAGLLLRFAWPPQAWRVRVEPAAAGSSRVEVALSARHDPALLQARLERLKRAALDGRGA